MIFKTEAGIRTRVTPTGNEGEYEFEVYGFGADRQKYVIDRFVKSGDDASTHIDALRVADALAFASNFGCGPSNIKPLT